MFFFIRPSPIISSSHFITPHQLDLNLCEANILSTYNIRLKYELKRSFSISTFHSLIQHNLCSWWACNQNKTQNLNFELFNQFRFWHTQKFFSCPNALYFHYFLIPVVCCVFFFFLFFIFEFHSSIRKFRSFETFVQFGMCDIESSEIGPFVRTFLISSDWQVPEFSMNMEQSNFHTYMHTYLSFTSGFSIQK